MDVTKRAGNEFKKCCAKLGAPVAPLRMNPRVVRWFTPGLHVKRWLVLLMVGMVLVSLGIGYALANVYRSGLVLPHIFYYLTLQFLDRYARFGLFAALGLGIILYALYKLTQSVLGPFLPGRDRALSEIIYNYRFLQKGPRVVALGGGTGLSTLLRGLKKYTGNLTAIVTVADDGGSSGRLRAEHRILPPGDFRQCTTAIKRVLLEPEPTINPEAEEAILNAEMIIVGPGSLYTSILPNLVVDGMAEALKASPAIKVFVCNVATQPGETDAFRVSDHLRAIESHMDTNIFDFVVVNSNNNFPLPSSAQTAGIKRVVYDPATVNQRSIHAVLVDVVNPRISTHHDPDKLARAIMKKIWRS